MNRTDKGNEAWTEAFRESYLSEPAPAESGDGWAAVSSLAARRRTRRRTAVAVAALLPLFVAGGIGLGYGLRTEGTPADGLLAEQILPEAETNPETETNTGTVTLPEVESNPETVTLTTDLILSTENIVSTEDILPKYASAEKTGYTQDGPDVSGVPVAEGFPLAGDAATAEGVDRNLRLPEGYMKPAEGDKTPAGKERKAAEEERNPAGEERKSDNIYESSGTGSKWEEPEYIEIVPRKEKKLLAALELSLNGMPGGSGPKMAAGGTGPGMMAFTTPFSPDTKQFEADPDEIYASANFRHHMPLGAGIGVNFALGDKLALESGLNYTLLWSELTPEGGNSRQNQYIHYLGIPLQLDWIFFNRAGFRLYTGIGGRMDICTGARVDGRKVKESPLQWSASATVGAAYNFNRHIGIYLRPELDYYITGTTLNSVRKAGGVNVTLRAGLQITL